MKPKTVLFCGTRSRYGLAHLSPVLETFHVTAVVCATDRRWREFEQRLSGAPKRFTWRIENMRLALYETKVWLKQLVAEWKLRSDLKRRGITVLQASDANAPAFVGTIKNLAPDLLLCAAYPQILSGPLISIPRQAAINFHPSALPKYRGAHPHFWAIAKGERTGGVSAHLMTKRVDEGDLVAQITFPIDSYYYEDYYRRIVDETPRLVAEVFKFVTDPAARPAKQDSAQASFFKNDKEDDWRILWSGMSALDVYNRIRTERAFCFFRSTKMHVARAQLITDDGGSKSIASEAGTILQIDGEVVVRANQGAIAFQAFREHGKLVPAGRWAREIGVTIGEMFT